MSGPPQALFVSYTAAFGGAEQILLDRADALPGPVALACPEGPLAERARAAGVEVHRLRPRRLEVRDGVRDRVAAPLRQLAQAGEVAGVVRRTRPRCVVANSMRALLSVTPAPLPRSIPVVFAHNDLLPEGRAAGLVRTAARRATHTVALSDAIARDLDPAGRMGVRLTTIYPGVDLDRFRPLPVPDEPDVLVLGALVDWKRPDLALEAAAFAAKDRPSLRIRLAGAPLSASGHALEGGLRRRAEEPGLAGRVEFAGRVEDTASALAGARCLLHCADREPFGLALVEALACGRPVVAAAAGGPAEIVDDSCGRLFAPGDPEAAAAALSEALDAADELTAGARARAEELFDVRASSAAFSEVIGRVTA